MDAQHSVVVYTNHQKKLFSITSRKVQGARLTEVNEQMANAGFAAIVLAESLHKETAENFRAAVKDAYESAGYMYVTRAELPNRLDIGDTA